LGLFLRFGPFPLQFSGLSISGPSTACNVSISTFSSMRGKFVCAVAFLRSCTGFLNWLVLQRGFGVQGGFGISLRHFLIILDNVTAEIYSTSEVECRYGESPVEILNFRSYGALPFRIYIFAVSPSRFSPSACFLCDLQG
jgi:hypothetical protein